MWYGYGFNSAASSPSPSSLPPPPPPPTPTDSLLDISPRKTSFSMTSGGNTYCAFPSWPNRSSLFSDTDSHSSASAFLSDEDLYVASTPSTSTTCSSAVGAYSEDDISLPSSLTELTTEEQIRRIQAARDEEQGSFFAHAQAHARAQQAHRAAQQVMAQQAGAARRTGGGKKRRVVIGLGDKKRRAGSSSSSSSGASTSKPPPV